MEAYSLWYSIFHPCFSSSRLTFFSFWQERGKISSMLAEDNRSRQKRNKPCTYIYSLPHSCASYPILSKVRIAGRTVESALWHKGRNASDVSTCHCLASLRMLRSRSSQRSLCQCRNVIACLHKSNCWRTKSWPWSGNSSNSTSPSMCENSGAAAAEAIPRVTKRSCSSNSNDSSNGSNAERSMT